MQIRLSCRLDYLMYVLLVLEVSLSLQNDVLLETTRITFILKFYAVYFCMQWAYDMQASHRLQKAAKYNSNFKIY